MIAQMPHRLHPMICRFDDFDKMMEQGRHRHGQMRKADGRFKPPVDVLEDDNNLYLNVELPGMRKEDVEIRIFDENILNISGEKKASEGEERSIRNEKIRNERYFGGFKRSFRLPDYIDSDNINAKFDSGVLTITMPRKKEEKPREIDIIVN